MCLGTIGVVTEAWTEDGVPLALVETPAGVERACLLGFPEATVGSNVLVHMGFVVEMLDPGRADEARRLRGVASIEEAR